MNKREFLKQSASIGFLATCGGAFASADDMKAASPLSQPLKVGDWEWRNRVVMSPLTRCRAVGGDRVPTPLMAEYYAQRAGAGLIISEATSISPDAVGYPNTPGLWTDEQVEGWKLVTGAVHAKGGLIVAQLWHVGRISDPMYLDGRLPLAPSAIKPAGTVSQVRPRKEYVTPRALELDEIPGVVADYQKAAENAKRAGFDGVELHGANGYLLDQFLQDSTNQRSDAYGGSIENRARLMLEAVDAGIAVFGAGRVGLHLSPRCDSHDMGDSDPAATFGYVAEQAGKRGIAFVFLREGIAMAGGHHGDIAVQTPEQQLAALDEPRLAPMLKQRFGGVLINNMNLTKLQAEEMIRRGEADAAAWGRQFIANPDLAERFRKDAELNTPDPSTFYYMDPSVPIEKGYTDYPALP